jgi:hypothetical protein
LRPRLREDGNGEQRRQKTEQTDAAQRAGEHCGVSGEPYHKRRSATSAPTAPWWPYSKESLRVRRHSGAHCGDGQRE